MIYTDLNVYTHEFSHVGQSFENSKFEKLKTAFSLGFIVVIACYMSNGRV